MKKLAKKNQNTTNTVSAFSSCYCSYCSCYIRNTRYSITYSIKRSNSVH
ncbi:CLI_3235 family bacteriocin precursor [Halodesulfovibrio aestuarii]